MDETWAIYENLRRFREMLKNEQDEAKRRTLEKLIADEEAKLPLEERGP
jgi:bacterioferritin (cytochrome b1)